MSHLQTELLKTSDHSRWMEVLEETGRYDFFHLPSFHRLAEIQGEGEAILAVCSEGNHLLALPMLVRDVPTADGWKDATSVYGYAGPLATAEPIPESVGRRFADSLSEVCQSLRLVTAFSRLHPLLPQTDLLRTVGVVSEAGVTTSVDLTLPADARRARYRKSHRYEIERLRNMGFACEEAGPDQLDEFVSIYTGAMQALDADPYYLFGRDYFDFLMREMSDVMHLFVCRDGNTVTCAALFSVCGDILQYYLAGTAPEYRKLAPMKLLLDDVLDWGGHKGAKTAHLGGGVGAGRDTLFEFKKGFGGDEHPYRTWRYVVRPDLYSLLCEAVGQDCQQAASCYFPAYRAPAVAGRCRVSMD